MDVSLDIFKYWDYRTFLKDYFREKKQSNPSYSLAVFANRGSLGSRSFVSLIIDGKRNLGLSTVYKFGKALDLDEKELRYFLGLVSFNQSKSEKEKEQLYLSLREMKPAQKTLDLNEKQEEFYSDWRLPVIYTLLSGEPMPRPADWIQERLIPKPKLPEVKALLSKLESLGFACKTEVGWKTEPIILVSSDDKPSFALRAFHKSMIENAVEATSLPPQDREISSATVKLNRNDFEKIRQQIKEFRTTLCKTYETEKGDETFVAQLNFQLFPITEIKEKP